MAVLGDRVVGFSDLTDDGVPDMLFVHPDAGDRGVATVLVTAVLEEARRRGLVRVETHASRTAGPGPELRHARGYVLRSVASSALTAAVARRAIC